MTSQREFRSWTRQRRNRADRVYPQGIGPSVLGSTSDGKEKEEKVPRRHLLVYFVLGFVVVGLRLLIASTAMRISTMTITSTTAASLVTEEMATGSV